MRSLNPKCSTSTTAWAPRTARWSTCWRRGPAQRQLPPCGEGGRPLGDALGKFWKWQNALASRGLHSKEVRAVSVLSRGCMWSKREGVLTAVAEHQCPGLQAAAGAPLELRHHRPAAGGAVVGVGHIARGHPVAARPVHATASRPGQCQGCVPCEQGALLSLIPLHATMSRSTAGTGPLLAPRSPPTPHPLACRTP